MNIPGYDFQWDMISLDMISNVILYLYLIYEMNKK